MPSRQADRVLRTTCRCLPQRLRARLLLGFARTGQQEYEKRSRSSRAPRARLQLLAGYNGLGYAYRPLHRYDERAAFKRYIQLIPDEPNPYDSYAELLLKIGRHAESIEMYRKALALDPHSTLPAWASREPDVPGAARRGTG